MTAPPRGPAPAGLDWSRDAAHWPHHEHSRFIEVDALRWHVQHIPARNGVGAPAALLIHGTGASSHSWRTLVPLLAEHFEVLTLDLPGHAHTRTPPSHPLSLPAMAGALAALLEALQFQPALVVGHSAGAAIGARLCLDGHVRPAALVSLNGALLPLHGMAGRLFSPLARLLAAQPLVPRAFAWGAAQPSVLQRLLDSTGSRLDAEGRRLYGRLVTDPTHAAGALRMMASWDLQPLAEALPRLPVPLHLLHGLRDTTVAPLQSEKVQRRVPGSTLVLLPGLGHLAHEEDAARVHQAMAAPVRAALAAAPA